MVVIFREAMGPNSISVPTIVRKHSENLFGDPKSEYIQQQYCHYRHSQSAGYISWC